MHPPPPLPLFPPCRPSVLPDLLSSSHPDQVTDVFDVEGLISLDNISVASSTESSGSSAASSGAESPTSVSKRGRSQRQQRSPRKKGAGIESEPKVPDRKKKQSRGSTCP